MMTIPASNCVNIWFYCGFVGREACCGVICQMSAEFFEEEGSREEIQQVRHQSNPLAPHCAVVSICLRVFRHRGDLPLVGRLYISENRAQ